MDNQDYSSTCSNLEATTNDLVFINYFEIYAGGWISKLFMIVLGFV